MESETGIDKILSVYDTWHSRLDGQVADARRVNAIAQVLHPASLDAMQISEINRKEALQIVDLLRQKADGSMMRWADEVLFPFGTRDTRIINLVAAARLRNKSSQVK